VPAHVVAPAPAALDARLRDKLRIQGDGARGPAPHAGAAR
jgi:hypothetical protein